MPKRREAPRSDDVSMLLQRAMEAKGRELGDTYSQRDLARDSDVDWSYVSKVLKGRRRPSPEVLRAWAQALAPYFPLDLALVAAGYAPADPRKRAWLQQVAGMTAAQWARFERRMGEVVTEEQSAEGDADQDAGDQRDDQAGDEDSPPPP